MVRPLKIVIAVIVVLTLFVTAAWWLMIWTPGSSYDDDMPRLHEDRQRLAHQLESDVRTLADDIGPRHVGRPEGLNQSVQFLENRLQKSSYEPARQTFEVRGVDCHNIEVELEGAVRPDEIVVIGAHYDSYLDTPAANDNASGVAAALHLAHEFSVAEPDRTLRFVFFVNEEPPWFQTRNMGSYRYAERSRRRGEDITAMVSLETIGYYSDRPGSQDFPIGALRWLYGDEGDFVSFVGNLGSRSVVHEAVGAFRDIATVPSEAAALPGFIPGVGWSDHWAFWEHDYPGIMVTDTALFRYPHYHTVDDTPEKLDYETMALVVEGLEAVVAQLVSVH